MYSKLPLFLLLFIFVKFSSAQLDSNSVLGIPTATLAQINSVTGAQEGAIAYASDTDKVYKFNGTSWEELANNNNASVYLGVLVLNATGNQTITGLPFQPTQISFVAHANVETLNLNSDNGTRNNETGLPNSFGTSTGFARNDGGTIIQQSIYVGGSGNSINDISRYASSAHCVGIRYGNQNGDNLGITSASLLSFNVDGFTLNVDSLADNVVVLFKAFD